MENRAHPETHLSISEKKISAAIAIVLTLASTWLMLTSASRELSWDEADYASSAASSWWHLWSTAAYSRHSHGPLAIYLAKLSKQLFSLSSSPEFELRFLPALFGSTAIGITYASLRHVFRTSREAALAGSSLTLLSVIRLQETNVVGPHHIMLSAMVLGLSLGYNWLNSPTIRHGMWIGGVLGVASIAMTYAIPLAVALLFASVAANGEWINSRRRRPAAGFWMVIATAVAVAAILWPPSAVDQMIIRDLINLVKRPGHPTLVGDVIVQRTPISAALYWLSHLDLPFMVATLLVVSTVALKKFRGRTFTARDAYLGASFVVILAVTLTAYLAGARNLVQLLGLMSLLVGVYFDDAFSSGRVRTFSTAVLIGCAALNLTLLSVDPKRVPYLATDGYDKFVKDNRSLLATNASVMVYGSPDLRFYALKESVPLAWTIRGLPWTTRSDILLPAEIEYALLPDLVCRHMPPTQFARRTICSEWKPVWQFESPRNFGLRLYQRPAPQVK